MVTSISGWVILVYWWLQTVSGHHKIRYRAGKRVLAQKLTFRKSNQLLNHSYPFFRLTMRLIDEKKLVGTHRGDVLMKKSLEVLVGLRGPTMLPDPWEESSASFDFISSPLQTKSPNNTKEEILIVFKTKSGNNHDKGRLLRWVAKTRGSWTKWALSVNFFMSMRKTPPFFMLALSQRYKRISLSKEKERMGLLGWEMAARPPWWAIFWVGNFFRQSSKLTFWNAKSQPQPLNKPRLFYPSYKYCT